MRSPSPSPTCSSDPQSEYTESNYSPQSTYSHHSPDPLRPQPLSIVSQQASTPSSAPTPTLLSPRPTPHPLPTNDPTLLHLQKLYNHTLAPTPSNTFANSSASGDTSIPILLTLLRARISSLPLESISIIQHFASSLPTSPSTKLKTNCTRALCSYGSTLTQTRMYLERLIELGEEIVLKEEGDGVGGKGKEWGRGDDEEKEVVRTDRLIWWFSARTVLAQADQFI